MLNDLKGYIDYANTVVGIWEAVCDGGDIIKVEVDHILADDMYKWGPQALREYVEDVHGKRVIGLIDRHQNLITQF